MESGSIDTFRVTRTFVITIASFVNKIFGELRCLFHRSWMNKTHRPGLTICELVYCGQKVPNRMYWTSIYLFLLTVHSVLLIYLVSTCYKQRTTKTTLKCRQSKS